MQDKNANRESLYWTILVIYAIALAILFWNQYRPRFVLSKCSEIALTESQSYSRNSLPTDGPTKSYDELLTECIQNWKF